MEHEPYDRVIRPFRLSDEQLHLATQLLSENILFAHYDKVKLISLTYSLHYRELPHKSSHTILWIKGSAAQLSN